MEKLKEQFGMNPYGVRLALSNIITKVNELVDVVNKLEKEATPNVATKAATRGRTKKTKEANDATT